MNYNIGVIYKLKNDFSIKFLIDFDCVSRYLFFLNILKTSPFVHDRKKTLTRVFYLQETLNAKVGGVTHSVCFWLTVGYIHLWVGH